VLYASQALGPAIGRMMTRVAALRLAAFMSCTSIAFLYFVPESLPPKELAQPDYGALTATTPVQQTDHKKHITYRQLIDFLQLHPTYTLIGTVCLSSQLAMVGVGQIYYLLLIHR
jgi:hypothetical protein